MCWETIVDTVNGLGTVLIAGAIACIAWRQHKTAHDKLRLDLYEKRFQIYSKLKSIHESIRYKEKLTEFNSGELSDVISSAKIFYKSEVADELEKALQADSDFFLKYQNQNKEPPNQELINTLRTVKEALNKAIKLMEPHISFSHLD